MHRRRRRRRRLRSGCLPAQNFRSVMAKRSAVVVVIVIVMEAVRTASGAFVSWVAFGGSGCVRGKDQYYSSYSSKKNWRETAWTSCYETGGSESRRGLFEAVIDYLHSYLLVGMRRVCASVYL